MKVLLVDTGFSSIPIYQYLVSAGHEVWTIGNRAHDVIARKSGERWIAQDYSDLAMVRHLAKRHGFDRIVPGCTDLSISICASLADGTGYLDSPKVNHLLNDKRAFRDLCAKLNLPAPHAISLDELPSSGRLICKPTDSFSGRGISVVEASEIESLQTAVELAKRTSPTGSVIVETFVSGQLHSFSAFIENRKVADAFFVLEASSASPYAVDTSYVCGSMPAICRATLIDAVEKIARELALVDGLVHTQFLWDGKVASIVEMTRRCPGDLYALLIEHSTGFRYADKYASYFVDDVVRTEPRNCRNIVRHTLTSEKDCVFSGLSFSEPSKIVATYPLANIGEPLVAGNKGRIAIMFFDVQTEASRNTLVERLVQRQVYHVL